MAYLRAKPKLDGIYRPFDLTVPNTKMSQDILDTKATIRTLPRLLLGAYYERREAYLSPCFTPARAHTRAAHHLSRAEYGAEPPDDQLLGSGVQFVRPMRNLRYRGKAITNALPQMRDGANLDVDFRI